MPVEAKCIQLDELSQQCSGPCDDIKYYNFDTMQWTVLRMRW